MISVKLPEGLETIANSAFSECPMQSIDLPSTIASLHAVAFHWATVEVVICRSTIAPTIPVIDDSGNNSTPFYQIHSSCVLKRPIGSDYSDWKSYFKGEIQDL